MLILFLLNKKCPVFPETEGTGRKLALPNHHPEAWTINLWCGVAGWNPLHPKWKRFSYCYGYCSFWLSTMPMDSRIEMRTGVWLSCHGAAAQKGKVPPTTWQDCIFFCPSIFNAAPRHLRDKFILTNSSSKGVEISHFIFHFKPLFVVPLPQWLSFRSSADGLGSKIHYWRSRV